jgi:phage tail sheath gpL-like
MALLDNIKLALRVDDSTFDSEINMLIGSGKQYLVSAGVEQITVDNEEDARVEQLLTLYTKALFGYNARDDQATDFPRTFYIILHQLSTDENYVEQTD